MDAGESDTVDAAWGWPILPGGRIRGTRCLLARDPVWRHSEGAGPPFASWHGPACFPRGGQDFYANVDMYETYRLREASPIEGRLAGGGGCRRQSSAANSTNPRMEWCFCGFEDAERALSSQTNPISGGGWTASRTADHAKRTQTQEGWGVWEAMGRSQQSGVVQNEANAGAWWRSERRYA